MSSARWVVDSSHEVLQMPDESRPALLTEGWPEIWDMVFEELNSASDLLSVIQTCWFFYSLATRRLYQHIYWKGPSSYTKNVSFWEGHEPSMALVPTSLTVSISVTRPSNEVAFVVEEDVTYSPTPHPIPVDIYASHTMYAGIMNRITTFSQLLYLEFCHCQLSEAVFPALKHLPLLQHFSLKFCTLPIMDHEPDTSFSELPITELTLWGIEGDSYRTRNSNYIYTLFLATAHNLRKLNTDWSPTSGRFLANRLPGMDIGPLTMLRELTLRFPLLPKGRGAGKRRKHLRQFLQRCDIVHLTTVGKGTGIIPEDTTLHSLESYCGTTVPRRGIPWIQSRPTLQSMKITGMFRPEALLPMLENLATFSPQLKSLSFRSYTWDTEIMHASVALFRELRDLTICFNEGLMAEQFLISLGSLFLSQLPSLESLKIYRTASRHIITNTPITGIIQPVDDDSIVKDSLAAWRKSCPLLREVQLKVDSVWQQDGHGNWYKRILPDAGIRNRFDREW